MPRRIRRPSPALVVACLALAVALSGTSYADVLNVPRNSVGTAHLKNNAVVSTKVKNRSLLAEDFRTGQLPAGPPGPAGAKGDKGDKGDAGPPGVAGYEIVVASSAQNSANKSAVASCPAGKRVLGGGASVPLVSPLALVWNRPSQEGTAWQAAAVEAVNAQFLWTLNAWAVCAQVG